VTGRQHPDSDLVDQLTALLNSPGRPSDTDIVERLTQSLNAGGRPIRAEPAVGMRAEVAADPYGLISATVRAGTYTIQVTQPIDDSSDLHIQITSHDADAEPDSHGLAISLDGHPLLDAIG